MDNNHSSKKEEEKYVQTNMVKSMKQLSFEKNDSYILISQNTDQIENLVIS